MKMDTLNFQNPTQADGRWEAVVSRNAAADGSFYYGVRTTGVYCRPSCPSRKPRRNNVEFFDNSEAAGRAGFRPCKRCTPDRPATEIRHSALVAAACRLIETSADTPDLATLAQHAGLSPYHFHRVFKKATGVTPKAYATAHRAKRVRAELGRSHSVTDAIYDAGFNSSSRFYENAGGVLGMTPGAWRSGGAELSIRFAVGECSLGSVLVAASARGVCAILLGDDPSTLVRDLQDQFPNAELVGGDYQFEGLIAKVVGFIDTPGTSLDLPLDVRGTAFQQRVWQALRSIPPGTTVSYTELAERLGAPAAARAVARACAANRIAVAIPCHRVVRNDGALSGYRWGVERKRELVSREKSL